ncbi:MAG: DUF2062 domain-containing protein [bacterium]|nr:DUF2062 domain-containing protein [bacterium]
MTDQAPDTEPRICVVLPTYNNETTVGTLIEQLRVQNQSVIVVNDGSTDTTAAVLESLAGEGVTVVTHDQNRGKGAALLTGFARAKELGFTHAVTMDTDGQHVVSDLPAVVSAVHADPAALVIGIRHLPKGRRPLKSRILRVHSNFWVWAETGHWVSDTQTGFRAYPLEPVLDLALSTSKYDFEIESLVKLPWQELSVVTVSVEARYGPGSKSHFRPLQDFLLVARLNALLTFQCFFLPLPVRQSLSRKGEQDGSFARRAYGWVRETIAHHMKPWRFAFSVGVGVCCGILPFWGFQMAAAVLAAHVLKLSKPVALAASNISFPAAIPFILYASLLTGRLILTGHIDYALHPSGLGIDAIWSFAAEYLLGAVVLAPVMGVVTGAGSYVFARVVTAAARRQAS